MDTELASVSGDPSVDVAKVQTESAKQNGNVGDPSPSTGEAELIVHEWLLACIRYGVLAVATAIWAVLGFFVWIPLLFRAILLLSGAVLYSSLVRHAASRAEARLRYAIEFYPRGFYLISSAVRGHRSQTTPDETVPGRHWLRICAYLSIELVVSAAFWFALGWAVQLWDLPSLDSLLELWSEIFNGIKKLL